jgi:hypothetical protein
MSRKYDIGVLLLTASFHFVCILHSSIFSQAHQTVNLTETYFHFTQPKYDTDTHKQQHDAHLKTY